MVDITHKSNTLRIATAQAIVKVSMKETIKAIEEKQVPKGDVFAASKAAGLLGIKKTADLLPDCHPLPIEFADIQYEIDNLEILIKVTIKTIYKTGVEVEAMHGASVAALNIYDMLKPLDPGVEIGSIRLLSKKGGKSQNRSAVKGISAAVVVCSDTVSRGEKEDRAGKKLIEILSGYGIAQTTIQVIPDEPAQIREIAEHNYHDLLIYTGGTGVGPRDCTPDTILPLLDTRLPGVEETIRRFGQDRMPFAMLSRSVVGVKDGNVILCVPGSTNGARESMEAILPGLFHIFHVLKGGRHD
ncbi:MAG: bifunctional molybdenum cofactor biosynthesis protein MoaC/MoaB [Bacteroidota bacterium]